MAEPWPERRWRHRPPWRQAPGLGRLCRDRHRLAPPQYHPPNVSLDQTPVSMSAPSYSKGRLLLAGFRGLEVGGGGRQPVSEFAPRRVAPGWNVVAGPRTVRRRIVAQDVAREGHPMNLIRAVINPCGARMAIHCLQRQVR